MSWPSIRQRQELIGHRLMIQYSSRIQTHQNTLQAMNLTYVRLCFKLHYLLTHQRSIGTLLRRLSQEDWDLLQHGWRPIFHVDARSSEKLSVESGSTNTSRIWFQTRLTYLSLWLPLSHRVRQHARTRQISLHVKDAGVVPKQCNYFIPVLPVMKFVWSSSRVAKSKWIAKTQ